jgi:aminoglycoside phosphotransferase (APT) family kinase protein
MAAQGEGATSERVEIPTKKQLRDLDAVRPDIQAWLRRHIPGADDLEVTEVRLPTGAGVANETLLVQATRKIGGARREVGYVVRVGATEHLFLGMDVETHYRLYDVLAHEPDIPSPPLVGFEPDAGLFGHPFFVMEKVEGLVPSDNPNFYEAGWVFELSDAERGEMWRNTVGVMAKLHRLDPAKFAILERPHLGRNGQEQELNHWINYAKWCGGDRYPNVNRAAQWLIDNLPENPPPGLSWGDSRPPNIIYQGVRCAAVLDWDMVSLAGAECDLAWWTYMDNSHTVGRGVPRPAGLGTPRQTVALWQELAGRRAENLDWHLVLNALRIQLVMVRLPALLQAAGQITAEQAAQLTGEEGRTEWLGPLLDAPHAGRFESAWPGWDD